MHSTPPNALDQLAKHGLYDPQHETDNCGFGMMVNVDDKPSHELVQRSIEALIRLEHRGAVAADGKSGDGCGLLLRMPEVFFRSIAKQENISLFEHFATGIMFIHPDKLKASQQLIESLLTDTPFEFSAWRTVPTDANAIGQYAHNSLPAIVQLFVNLPKAMPTAEAETRLYILRRQIEKALVDDPAFFIPSFSTQTICYKGLVTPEHIADFYLDLKNPEMASSICVFHQRFSTNTLPQWRLAQPFRYIAHNGEINTLRGNLNWAQAREKQFSSEFLNNIEEILPIVNAEGSDSQSLDNMVEALVRLADMPLYKAVRILIPPAWQNIKQMDSKLRAFYHYHAIHQESWDGPAGLVMTDGRYAVCTLDRNGLRPARWILTKENHLIVASEIGVYDCDPSNIAAKGRIGSGEMLAVDVKKGEILSSTDINDRLKTQQPYRKWLNEHLRSIKSRLTDYRFLESTIDPDKIDIYKKMFNITNEENEKVISVLAKQGKEAIGSMGDDCPLAILSHKIRPLYDYFRQYFAQVTNPPIDSLRESLVMSLETYFGQEENCYSESAIDARATMVSSPVLSCSKFDAVLNLEEDGFRHEYIDLNYPESMPWQTSLKKITDKAVRAIKSGKAILLLSDKNIRKGCLPVHALLATGAVHQHLLSIGLRAKANILLETATARDPHHFAALIAFGATAIFPYLAYACINHRFNMTNASSGKLYTLRKQYRTGINVGLFKVLSKMGISTIASYRASQLYEAIGLNPEVINLCFTGTTSRLKGIGFKTLQAEQSQLAKLAWRASQPIEQGGRLQYSFTGEYHAYNPDVVTALLRATKTGKQKDYDEYKAFVNQRPIAMLRDMFGLVSKPIALEQVEAVEKIYPRFDSAAMSLGALSPEAHEALAVAMNRLGARSNSGEGGENPLRYKTEANSKIKQVASGRFGVTAAYLVSAQIIQIKMAQGAKPGEGGQLPGHKVDEFIAGLRYSRPGIALISPPPHHDIYSIEDLAQLIYDLKQVNEHARIAVKLVSKPGVGTIAAGVAKAGADMITISGHDGGTGASPLTSTNNAGGPWELGLSEAHQVLMANGLRNRICLQADGGLKTGLDVVKAAILGADSFGFGTAPMIAEGCKYLRVCHLNNCATGVATQDETLRKNNFIGTPERVTNYFQFVAIEVRECLAQIGAKNINDVIGRVDLLEKLPAQSPKQSLIDLSAIIDGYAQFNGEIQHCTNNAPFDNASSVLMKQILNDVIPCVTDNKTAEFSYPLKNTDRSIAARLAGRIATLKGLAGIQQHPITLQFTGVAGQSFGVWNLAGMHLRLEGEANDYVGKGMNGGKITIYPSPEQDLPSNETPIMGNACLYGATGGEVFAAGKAGERFAVRNSGAIAVLEGVGDHCCEYMTDGTVLVLGETGRNFGAGMTGGLAYVLDMNREFVDRFNTESVLIDRLQAQNMEAYSNHLQSLIETYVEQTHSSWGQEILDDYYHYLSYFWLVRPIASRIDELIQNIKEPL